MAYIDYMVVPVPLARLAEYKALARKSAKLWKKHGALGYSECIAEDVKPGKHTSYPQSVKLKADEVVGACHITFRSKAHRNAVWKKIMADPFMASYDMKNAPFDGKRMYFGGFKTIVAV